LIVAQNASTRFGGEAIIPVHYFRVLRERGFRVGLLAHVRNREDMEEVFGPNCDGIYYIEDTIWHRVIWQIGRIFPRRISEGLFGTLLNVINEHYQRRSIRRLVAAARADIIHQPIPVSPIMPSSLHGFGVPVVIGPMNGGMTYPPGWEALESTSERYFVRLARLFSPILNLVIAGKANADVLLVANERTRAALPINHPRVKLLVENGVDLSTFRSSTSASLVNIRELRLVFLGRLVAWKAVDVTLAALAKGRARGLTLTLDILGDGPDRKRLERLTRDLGLEDCVRYLGFRPQPECVEILQTSDALILNSVFECGGAVVLEAMSLGLPVIASDWGGPADYVTESTGILVAPTPRVTFAERLADAIEKLAIDPSLRARLGEAGLARVREHFDWERKVDRMLEIYQEALFRCGT
jgi:glycosyltransferase involved in cell wall biosynthesis